LKSYTIPESTTLASGAYITFDCYKENTAGPAFGLSKKCEAIYLFDSTGALIDKVVTPTFAASNVYSYAYDGSAWQITTTPTKGSENTITEPVVELPEQTVILQ